MNNDDLDRMLLEREEIVPSSGFVASVMEAVQQEATAPAPIPFPWKWALPGLLVSVTLAIGMIARWIYVGPRVSQIAQPGTGALPMERLWSALPPAHVAVSTWAAFEWSALALLLSFTAAWISMRIAGVRE
ncbi:MAG: hypothetical protein V4587_02070 [Acidobacteriota bacterium]